MGPEAQPLVEAQRRGESSKKKRKTECAGAWPTDSTKPSIQIKIGWTALSNLVTPQHAPFCASYRLKRGGIRTGGWNSRMGPARQPASCKLGPYENFTFHHSSFSSSGHEQLADLEWLVKGLVGLKIQAISKQRSQMQQMQKYDPGILGETLVFDGVWTFWAKVKSQIGFVWSFRKEASLGTFAKKKVGSANPGGVTPSSMGPPKNPWDHTPPQKKEKKMLPRLTTSRGPLKSCLQKWWRSSQLLLSSDDGWKITLWLTDLQRR